MSKRPAAAKKAKTKELVLPEIEIITKPEADIDLLSNDRQTPETRVPVSPAEVLPTVGNDATTRTKKYRVIDVQKALKNAVFSTGPVDGKMGPKTKKAIQEFQKKHNLTVDGIVGAKTWAAVKPYLDSSQTESKD